MIMNKKILGENIRNFCIISHIDHGKSTLADRFLELTSTVENKKMKPQFLDMMDLERERGITIKLQPVRMFYKGHILNMIDTPGHVDFSYEVSRSLAAIEGAILLVDASKGIQAQTLSNLELAKKQNVKLIPVVNKVDLLEERSAGLTISYEKLNEVIKETAKVSGVREEDVLQISAKKGLNIEEVLKTVIEKVQPPLNASDTKALIFDFQYDNYKGVVAFVRVFGGQFLKGQEVLLLNSKAKGKIKELGYFSPELTPKNSLEAGEIGYLVLGIKESEKVKIGDTVALKNVKPLPGYKEPKPVIFMGLFPDDTNNWNLLREALIKLKLNDPALSLRPEAKSSLGRGFLCGFLGLLHAEIVVERLKREYNLRLMTSAPSICYRVTDNNNEERLVCSVLDWPEEYKDIKEQICALNIIVPKEHLSSVLTLLEGKSFEIKTLGIDKDILRVKMPFREIMSNFYDKLKSATKGFASMDYEVIGFQKANVVKLEILIAGKEEEVFSSIVLKDEAYNKGKTMVEKLEKNFPPQLFDVPIQARVGGNIIVRRTIRAKRKDVTAGLYGGDYTRKKKLLKKQRKGKKKLEESAKIKIPQEVVWKIFKT
jgi:GTP-binding protein LepA